MKAEYSESGTCLLGIDMGTSALKSAIIDAKGKVLARADKEYPTFHPKPGWAEHSSEIWWGAAKETIRIVLTEGKVPPENIAGVSVSSLSPAILPVNEDGKPLRRAIIWMDTRGGKPHDPLPKVLWIKENEPEIFNKTYKFLLANGFINYKLTNQFTADISQSWWAKIEELASELDRFPPTHNCSDVIGEVTAEASRETGLAKGTPVVAGAADGLCAMIGSGIVKNGQAVEFTGQSCGLCICTDKDYPEVQDTLGFSLPYIIPGTWVVAGAMSSGGGVLKWFRDTLGSVEVDSAKRMGLDPYQIMDREASEIPPGSDGLIILPYFAGERSPIWNANARGVLFGLYLSHTRAHIIRAILESVAYGLRHNMEIAERAGVRIKEFRACGGGARSKIWLQIKADVLGKSIYPVRGEAETRGDAILAGIGVGVFKDFISACEKTVKVGEEIKPNFDNYEHYTKLYRIYRELYEQVKGSFDKLAETQKT